MKIYIFTNIYIIFYEISKWPLTHRLPCLAKYIADPFAMFFFF